MICLRLFFSKNIMIFFLHNVHGIMKNDFQEIYFIHTKNIVANAPITLLILATLLEST